MEIEELMRVRDSYEKQFLSGQAVKEVASIKNKDEMYQIFCDFIETNALFEDEMKYQSVGDQWGLFCLSLSSHLSKKSAEEQMAAFTEFLDQLKRDLEEGKLQFNPYFQLKVIDKETNQSKDLEKQLELLEEFRKSSFCKSGISLRQAAIHNNRGDYDKAKALLHEAVY